MNLENLRTGIGIGMVALTLAGGAAGLVATEAGAAPTCGGKPATITAGVNDVTVNGTPGDDVIVGNRLDNTMAAGQGDDLVCGGEGDDAIQGNDGSDRLFGGPDADILLGGDDGDRLFGEGGQDRLAGDTVAAGDSGADRCDGGKGRGDKVLVNGDASPGFEDTCETQISLEKVADITP